MKKILKKDIDISDKASATSNLEKLSELFPEVISDGQINVDVLLQICGLTSDVSSEERFGFNWPGKNKARLATMSPSSASLRPDHISKKSKNIFIEGDNFEVLKTLQKSYHKKIGVIYIDPPYNTGKDFIYTDNYKDSISNYL